MPAFHCPDQLAREHSALLHEYARAQARCTDRLREQAREIDTLRAGQMRLRAALVARETALIWEREDRAALEEAIPGLPGRLALKQRIAALLERVQELMRERLRGAHHAAASATPSDMPAVVTSARPDAASLGLRLDNTGELEAGLRDADLVICQIGCASHGDYWRVEDHCKRTGKACVLVEQPDALRIVRIHREAREAEDAGHAPEG